VLQTVTGLALRLAFRDVQDAEVAALFDKRSAVNGVVAVPMVIVNSAHDGKQLWVWYSQLVSSSISSRDRAESLEAEAELDEQVDVQLHVGSYYGGQYQQNLRILVTCIEVGRLEDWLLVDCDSGMMRLRDDGNPAYIHRKGSY
jgi:hypothetical protein